MTAIEWTDVTWNPVTGCSKVSPGCANCYAENVARRFPERFADPWLPWTPENAEHNVRLHPDRLEQPLRWRKPRRVFVNSMSDLFHEQVPLPFIASAFETMAKAPQHTFQVLTKRPERAGEILGALDFERFVDRGGELGTTPWPLPNVWLGVSIENARHTYRADILREIPAAVRFISAEPLIDSLYPALAGPDQGGDDVSARRQRTEHAGEASAVDLAPAPRARKALDLTGIDWVIIGGESGPGARPLDLAWVREIIDAALHKTTCALNPYASSTIRLREERHLCDCGAPAVFVKQLGSVWARGNHAESRKGGDPAGWPADLRIREWPR